MSHEYVYKISSRYLQKWLRYDIKHVKKQALFTSFRDYRHFPNFYFLTDFDTSQIILGSFSRSLRKPDLKTCIAALNHETFCLTFFTWWPDMTLTSIMVIKHSKWYLQMSVTLSMPISWLSLCLTLARTGGGWCNPPPPPEVFRG